jgi:hypothetical protein
VLAGAVKWCEGCFASWQRAMANHAAGGQEVARRGGEGNSLCYWQTGRQPRASPAAPGSTRQHQAAPDAHLMLMSLGLSPNTSLAPAVKAAT